MLARTDSRIRAVVMLAVASLVVGLIGYRLVWWQVIDQDHGIPLGLFGPVVAGGRLAQGA